LTSEEDGSSRRLDEASALVVDAAALGRWWKRLDGHGSCCPRAAVEAAGGALEGASFGGLWKGCRAGVEQRKRLDSSSGAFGCAEAVTVVEPARRFQKVVVSGASLDEPLEGALDQAGFLERSGPGSGVKGSGWRSGAKGHPGFGPGAWRRW
jgi:hypothetical protein